MKKLLLTSMVLFVIMSMAALAVGSITVSPTSENTEIFLNRNVTKTVTITNNGSTALPINLPTTMTFSGTTPGIAIPVSYNPSSVTVPASSSVVVDYSIYIPKTAKPGSYVGNLSLGDASNHDTLNTNLDIKSWLVVEDLDITVEDVIADEKDDHKNVNNGDRIKVKAKPAGIITFDFRMQNLYSDDDDIAITDGLIEMIIANIDDGDDLEEESDDFDIDPDDKSNRLEIPFEIPLEVDEDTYDVEILITAEDDDGIEYKIEWDLTLQVDKETHYVYIKNANVDPSTIKCNRNVKLDIDLQNIGSRDEDAAVLEVKSSNLGVDIKETELEIEAYDGDDKYSSSYDLDISDDVEAGKYSLVVKTYYDETKLSDTAVVDITVEDCVATTTTTTPTTTTPPTTTPPTTTTTTSTTTQGGNNPVIVSPPIITDATSSSEEKSFTETPVYIWTLVSINIIGVGVLIFFVVRKFVLKL